jgi:hypothetical protein
MDEEKVHEAIAALEHEVPRDGAKVKLCQYGGGPDEGQIIANQAGYLRLGIELLKGAFSPAECDKGSTAVQIDLEYLITNDSTINFDWFERREIIDSTALSATGRLIGILFLFIIALLGVFAIVGIATVVGWFAT